MDYIEELGLFARGLVIQVYMLLSATRGAAGQQHQLPLQIIFLPTTTVSY